MEVILYLAYFFGFVFILVASHYLGVKLFDWIGDRDLFFALLTATFLTTVISTVGLGLLTLVILLGIFSLGLVGTGIVLALLAISVGLLLCVFRVASAVGDAIIRGIM